MPSGIAVGIDDGDDGDAELLGLGDGDLLLVGVDHEQQVGQAAHFLDAAERLVERVAIARELQDLLLGSPLGLAGKHFVQLLQPADRLRDCFPVGERAAEPAMIDEVLGGALGGIGDALGGLTLGADEQHAAAAGDDVADLDQRLMQQGHRLGEVDDVNVVAGAEDEGRHLRIPAVALMAEVTAGLEQLTHIEGGKRHGNLVLFRLNRHGTLRRPALLEPAHRSVGRGFGSA